MIVMKSQMQAITPSVSLMDEISFLRHRQRNV
jgi:hypothetical protein